MKQQVMRELITFDQLPPAAQAVFGTVRKACTCTRVRGLSGKFIYYVRHRGETTSFVDDGRGDYRAYRTG